MMAQVAQIAVNGGIQPFTFDLRGSFRSSIYSRPAKGDGGPTKIAYCHSSTASGRKALPADVSVGIRQSPGDGLTKQCGHPVPPTGKPVGARDRRLKWKSS